MITKDEKKCVIGNFITFGSNLLNMKWNNHVKLIIKYWRYTNESEIYGQMFWL